MGYCLQSAYYGLGTLAQDLRGHIIPILQRANTVQGRE